MKIPRPMFGEPIGPWRRWFAWYPVFTYDGWMCWFCFVWARRIQTKAHLPGPCDQWWQYSKDDPGGGDD